MVGQLKHALSTFVLTCRFIGEETSADNGEQIKLTDDPTWIIDPIDGTSNFVHGYDGPQPVAKISKWLGYTVLCKE